MKKTQLNVQMAFELVQRLTFPIARISVKTALWLTQVRLP
jgi:hypothetical protein